MYLPKKCVDISFLGMYGMRRGCDHCQIKGMWISLNHSVPAGKYSLAVTILGVSLSTAAARPCATGGS